MYPCRNYPLIAPQTDTSVGGNYLGGLKLRKIRGILGDNGSNGLNF